MTFDVLKDFDPSDDTKQWLIEKVGPLCLSTRPTLFSSYALAKYIAEMRIPGSVVECGVFAGGQMISMYHGTVDGNDVRHRKFHLFDSFEGIPHAGPEDTDNIDGTLFSHGKDGALVTSGISSCGSNSVRSNLETRGVPLDACVIWEGWFQDTIPSCNVRLRKIALLRLDADLYESTKACWPLLDKVQKGGVVIVDDYALKGCRQAIHEYLKDRKKKVTIQPIPGGGGPVFWIEP